MKECDKIRDLFGLYLYNSVTPTERSSVEQHIDECEECADDLRSRQKVLEKIQPSSQPEDMPQRTQDRFARGVYRRIALESLQRRSRQSFLRRFVLQPSLAAVALAAGIGIGFLRFHPGTIIVGEPAPSVAQADETDRRELRAASYMEEFLERQGISYYTREPGDTAVDGVSSTEQTSSDIDPFMQDRMLTDSRHRLEDANLIYSLGDAERALAAYQRLVDDHPDTDAAAEAQGKISVILNAGI